MLLVALAGDAIAKDPSYIGSVQAIGTADDGTVARGTVFLDADRTVAISVDGGPPVAALRTQPGEGEGSLSESSTPTRGR